MIHRLRTLIVSTMTTGRAVERVRESTGTMSIAISLLYFTIIIGFALRTFC